MNILAEQKPNFAPAPFVHTTKRAFISTGAEGSGTYMLAEAIVATGEVFYHSTFEHEPIHPDDLKRAENCDIVIHRSLPHAGKMPDLEGLRSDLVLYGGFSFENITTIFMAREMNATIKSVIRRNPELTYDEQYNIWRKAFQHMSYEYYIAKPIILVTYSAFCLSEGFRRWLFEERLQLPYPEDFEVKEQNSKYYD
jgi:hypothetical protein